MPLAKSYRLVLLSLALVTSCAKQEEKQANPAQAALQARQAETALVEQIINTPSVDKINGQLTEDDSSLLELTSWGPSNSTEQRAIDEAKRAMELVRSARDHAEERKRIAADAKDTYASRQKDYQQALNTAETARKNRAKAMSALASAQKEYDDAWATVASARETLNKALSDPSSSEDQKAKLEKNLQQAEAAARQASQQVENRTTELQSAQRSNQSQLTSAVNASAEEATRAAIDFANKANLATKALASLNQALAQEKAAMATISSLNRARAKAIADTLEEAAYDFDRKSETADTTKRNAKAAAGSQQSAESKLKNAIQESANADQRARSAAEALIKATANAKSQKQNLETANAEAARVQKDYAAAKAVLDTAQAVSKKSAGEAWLATKAVKEATAKAEKARQSANWAAKVHQQKNTAESKKTLDTLNAAAEKAEEALRLAQESVPEKKEKAASDAAALARAKAEADARLTVLRKSNSEATSASKEKAQADAALASATKNAASTQASAKARAEEEVKARGSLASAEETRRLADRKNEEAARAAAAAQAHYNRVYSKIEAYKLSPTRTEREELSDEQKLYSAALWSKVPEGNYWTSLVVASIREFLPSLERARDINDWCPGYWNASEHHREVCWLRLIGGIVKLESSFKPDDKFREPSGAWSVGLLALSPKECKRYETVEMLQKPLLNLSCGIGMLARFVERDGYLHGPKEALGASKYWSTLRTPYTQRKPDGKGYYKLGKKPEIQAFTTSYRNY